MFALLVSRSAVTSPVPNRVLEVAKFRMAAFRCFFTAPVWDHALVLVAGMVLAPGKRTVSAALRIMGLGTSPGFARYHHVLSRARWDRHTVHVCF